MARTMPGTPPPLPTSSTLSPGANLSRNRTQIVPANAPAGTYRCEGRVGVYPDTVWARSSFTVVKQGVEVSAESENLSGWETFGEEFGEDPWLINGVLPINPSLQLNISPNPANPLAEIQFNVPTANNVNLIIFDVVGREVAELVNGMRNPGNYTITWDASDRTSGVYVVRLLVSASGTIRQGSDASAPTTFCGKVVVLK